MSAPKKAGRAAEIAPAAMSVLAGKTLTGVVSVSSIAESALVTAATTEEKCRRKTAAMKS
jgi:hypothetical protein